jgi:hypothetical protein
VASGHFVLLWYECVLHTHTRSVVPVASIKVALGEAQDLGVVHSRSDVVVGEMDSYPPADTPMSATTGVVSSVHVRPGQAVEEPQQAISEPVWNKLSASLHQSYISANIAPVLMVGHKSREAAGGSSVHPVPFHVATIVLVSMGCGKHVRPGQAVLPQHFIALVSSDPVLPCASVQTVFICARIFAALRLA